MAAQQYREIAGASDSASAELFGDAAVRLPDLRGQAVELGQVGIAEAHPLPPAGDVDGEQLVQVAIVDRQAVQVELVLRRQDAMRGRDRQLTTLRIQRARVTDAAADTRTS